MMISPKLQVYLEDLGIGSTAVYQLYMVRSGEKKTDGGKAAKFFSSKVGSPQVMSKTKIIIIIIIIIINTFKNQEVIVQVYDL